METVRGYGGSAIPTYSFIRIVSAKILGCPNLGFKGWLGLSSDLLKSNVVCANKEGTKHNRHNAIDSRFIRFIIMFFI